MKVHAMPNIVSGWSVVRLSVVVIRIRAGVIALRRTRLVEVAEVFRPGVVDSEIQPMRKTLLDLYHSRIIIRYAEGRVLNRNVSELREWPVLLRTMLRAEN